MRNFLLVLLMLSGCATSMDLDGGNDSADTAAVGAVAALEGTREGHGVLRLLNDGPLDEGPRDEGGGTDFVFLDDDVALDRRAAANLIEHRNGEDGVFGTADDDLFDTIAEVDAVSWVGPAALRRLEEFALQNDYVPGEQELLGTFDGVDFSFAQAEAVMAFANTATDTEFRAASVPSRAVTSIVAGRPIWSIDMLAELYWVGPRTLEHLIAAITAPVGGEDCATSDECSEGLVCYGRPEGFAYGKCRDLSSRPGLQADCDQDSDCNEDLICIAQSVYGQGYCALSWMRDTFEIGGQSSIPSVVMSQPTASRVTVYGQATVPEDIVIDIDIEHSDPTSLWIGLEPPTGQEPVTLWDGATMEGPLPTHYVDHQIYRDDSINGRYRVLIQNVGGRGEGVVRGIRLQVSSRFD